LEKKGLELFCHVYFYHLFFLLHKLRNIDSLPKHLFYSWFNNIYIAAFFLCNYNVPRTLHIDKIPIYYFYLNFFVHKIHVKNPRV
jgi:hypothetical protein